MRKLILGFFTSLNIFPTGTVVQYEDLSNVLYEDFTNVNHE